MSNPFEITETKFASRTPNIILHIFSGLKSLKECFTLHLNILYIWVFFENSENESNDIETIKNKRTPQRKCKMFLRIFPWLFLKVVLNFWNSIWTHFKNIFLLARNFKIKYILISAFFSNSVHEKYTNFISFELLVFWNIPSK